MEYHSNQVEKSKIERVFNDDQNFCIDCKGPINKNCHTSDKMNGVCKKCFNSKYRENEKRKMNKNRTKDRKNQRAYKHCF